VPRAPDYAFAVDHAAPSATVDLSAQVFMQSADVIAATSSPITSSQVLRIKLEGITVVIMAE
jgi:hypothetical protein